ncbi:N-acetyltransferase [Oceanicaulis sp. MMSF_3324]|uniref:GNAT family N-acetyltransferase n=1 Tax=Oceanicaulis sp. MMSF_3324 TaxID=3046702 RepID=UPI00273FCA73|nr:N-acetyltransferase [Oceanicaulis sp. MMSF_3324]
MAQGVSVRAATISDLPALMQLETRFPSGDRISVPSWRRFLSREGCVQVAASDAGVCGAAVVLIRKGAKAARLYSLAVDERDQGQGVGRRLVEAALAYAAKAGCARLSLEVRPDNPAARALYRKCGFVEAGAKPGHYADGTAAMVMNRAVPEEPAETFEQ